jgi:hypothetical protein
MADPFERVFYLGVERIDLTGQLHAEQQRWRNGWEWGPFVVFVAVGQMADGRWYADWYGRARLRRGAAAYAGEHAEWLARRTAGRWMRTVGGTWVEA